MFKTTIFILFAIFSSCVFSQENDVKASEKANVQIIKNTPKQIAFYKGELNNNTLLNNDSIPKPELRLFAIDQLDTISKKADSIFISEPKLIPYTGYNKENDH